MVSDHEVLIDHVERVEEIEIDRDFPEGNFNGRWSGYEVDVWIEGWYYRMHVPIGVLGVDIPCIVHVHDGKIWVTMKGGE